MGEMVWLEWTELGECPEVYDMTLDAGVKAGVSMAEETGAPLCAWDEMPTCEDAI
jgi:hypothetical protein